MRTRRVGSASGWPVPPAELAERCWVEDWCSEAELARLRARPEVDPPWVVRSARWSWREEARLLAFRRHRAARRAWLVEHGVPHGRAAEVIPLRRPTWRVPLVG